MRSHALSCFLLSIPSLSAALSNSVGQSPSPLTRRDDDNRDVPASGFYDPRTNGGSFLDNVPNTGGLHEPINAIILGTSDNIVLIDQQANGGLRNYFQALGFSGECLGQHQGAHQQANLGDGNGYLNETAVIRWNYGDPSIGTCKESVIGGNHFRYWVQDGKNGNSGAVFLAVSYELPSKDNHNIVPNGFNLGRDWLVGNATGQPAVIPTNNLTNSSTYSGQTTASDYVYQTSVQYVSGLLDNSSDGINHADTVSVDGQFAIDGLVALLSVNVLQQPTSATANSADALTWSAGLLLLASLASFAPLLL
ncbi:hypothetical protein OF83DRAFT_799235 [Amylostereum chailletii]|nr:hypothetical protein OF83DRAFT_799235 [Amylostereum chailletii]